jgi:hypothetical protein
MSLWRDPLVLRTIDPVGAAAASHLRRCGPAREFELLR